MRKWLLVLALCAGAGIIAYIARSPQKQPPPQETPRQAPSSLPVLTQASAPTPTQAAGITQNVESPVSPPPASPAISTDDPGPSLSQGQTPATSSLGEIGQSKLPPAIILENMRIVVRDYGLRFGGNPIGNNAEITQALNGGNPKQVDFIRPDSGLRINGQGELVDAWGTPFFFHQLSGTQTEIHSAGPDRVMWTSDDLVTK